MKDFINKLQSLGLVLYNNGDALQLKKRTGKLSAEDIERLRRETDVIPFIKKNKQQLLNYLDKHTKTEVNPQLSFNDISAIYKLSPLQEGMLFHAIYDQQSKAYTIQLSLDFPSGLNVAAFEQAWGLVLRERSILRTSFIYDKVSLPLQCVHQKVKLPIEVIDLSDLADPEQASRIASIQQEDFEKGFNLDQPPLLRITLIKTGQEVYHMIFSHHHILLDGWSLQKLIADLLTAYQAIDQGKQPPVNEEDHYQDYIKLINKLDVGEAKRFWSTYLEGFSDASLLPFVDSGVERNKGQADINTVTLKLSEQLTTKVKAFAKKNRITPNTLIQGVWGWILSRYTNQSDVLFGVTVSGRPTELLNAEDRVGLYINTLPLRVQPKDEKRMVDWLKDLQDSHTDAREFQYCALSEIQSWAGIRGDFFDSLLIFENYPLEDLAGADSVLPIANPKLGEQTNYLLTLIVVLNKTLDIHFNFYQDLLAPAYVQQMKQHFQVVLEQIVGNPALHVNELELLSEEERQQVLFDFNDTEVAYPRERTIVDLIEEKVAQQPDAIALSFLDGAITYKELGEKTDRLAAYLMGQGIQAGDVVGICLERSIEMVIGLLGILKTGAAYIPLDTTYPISRLRFMVEDSGIKYVLTQEDAQELIPTEKLAQVFCLEHIPLEELSAEEVARTTALKPSANSLAYLIYTSGSTGNPKGVMIRHRNVMNFFAGLDQKVTSRTEKEVWLAVTSISFDISVLEIFWTLTNGHHVVIQSDRPVAVEHAAKLDFSLFYFAAQEELKTGNKYDLLLQGAKFADQHDLKGIWVPERHFHSFGDQFPNPSIAAAAVAATTERVKIRSGSLVLPLHDPIRVAENWSMIDNLSNGRVELSLASGWHPNDFVFYPENYENRHEIFKERVQLIGELWKGASCKRENGNREIIEITIHPRPLQAELPIWITAAGNPATFEYAGSIGANILTHLLGQDIEELKEKIRLYRQSRQQNGFDPQEGKVALMMHTFVGESMAQVEAIAKEPFKNYLRHSLNLLAPLARDAELNIEDDIELLIETGYQRYSRTSGLFGTPESCYTKIKTLISIGIDEVACLIDFGVEPQTVIEHLPYLEALQTLTAKSQAQQKLLSKRLGKAQAVEEVLIDKEVTCIQCTPTYAQDLVSTTEGQQALQRLQKILIGGEMFPPVLAAQLLALIPDGVFNMYGPTETTVWSTIKLLQKDDDTTIGKPIANTQIYILASDLKPQPIGAVGELYIGGEGLAVGYLNREELTSERFRENPFIPGQKIYQTGDLARWLPNGELDCLGRIDNQVKIRGHRIELNEIEEAIQAAAAVKQCVVVARADLKGNKRLLAYLVSEGHLDKDQLQELLKTKLPAYMLPHLILEVEKIPLTPNGKINRKALPLPEELGRATNITPPRTPTEKKLATIWSKLLQIDEPGVFQNFFDLGGHSLKATRIVSRIKKMFGVDVPLKDFFFKPTIADVALLIDRDEPGLKPSKIIVQERTKLIPLSYSQQGVWFIDKLAGSVNYHDYIVLRLQGQLNIPALTKAFQTIVNRHEILRTTYREQDGKAFQWIGATDEWELDYQEYTVLETLTIPHQLIKTEIKRPFDLTKDHMLRVQLIKLGAEDYVLNLITHHIASDGWSIHLFVREWIELYQAYLKDRKPQLPSLPIQYADYAIWQRESRQQKWTKEGLAYWKQRLRGVETIQLPWDQAPSIEQDIEGDVKSFLIRKSLAVGLYDLARKEETTLYNLLFAAFKVLLYRLSNQTDICVGTPVANRNQAELEPLIGYFVNTIPLRSNLGDNPRFIDFLAAFKTELLEAFRYQEVPLDQIIDAIGIERDPRYHPLFQVVFALQVQADTFEHGVNIDGLTISPESIARQTTRFDLHFSITETTDGLVLDITYRSKLFSSATIERIKDNYETLLSSILVSPQQRLNQLAVISAREEQEITRYTRSKVEYASHANFLQLFSHQVLEYPNAIALEQNGKQLTYQELDKFSNQLANYLRKQEVDKGSVVAIVVNDPLQDLGAILAILKTGATYVPIQPDLPSDRIQYMLADTRACLLINNGSNGLDTGTVPVLSIDQSWSAIQEAAETFQIPNLEEDQLCYIIYTSGSTGVPKGVMVTHGNLTDYLHGLFTQVDFVPGMRYALLSTLAADLGNTTVFGSLASGGSLHLFTKERILDAHFLHVYFKENRMDTLKIVPSQWNALMLENNPLLPQKSIIFGGEKLLPQQLSWIQQTDASLKVYNHYGPTETTIGKLIYQLDPDEVYDTIPIGYPFGNSEVFITNDDLEICPIGVTGELLIGGKGLAQGYLNQTRLTEEKFIQNSFIDSSTERLYKTGDLVRLNANGQIEFRGRKDKQVKIRGYRVELTEIESVLLQHEAVEQCVVQQLYDPANNTRLVAYVVSHQALRVNAARAFLKKQLPEYMIPSILIDLEQIPLTDNGKIDFTALPTPDFSLLEKDNYQAPRNELEEKIVMIWQEFLGLDKVGVYDNFFELGGHSLLATRIVSAIRERHGIKLQLTAIFKYTSIADIVKYIRAIKSVEETREDETLQTIEV